jgi:hypothetical protein
MAEARPRGEMAEARPRGEMAEARPRGEMAEARPRGEMAEARPRGEMAARPRGEMAEARPRGEAWTQEETILLIELWADERVQEQLENTPRRNIEIFKRICEDIKDRIPDFQRSPQECQAI